MAKVTLSEAKKQEILLRNIKKELTKLGSEYRWVLDDFEEIVSDASIKSHLEKAYNETRSGFINKHGRTHGLQVVAYIIEIFKLIHYDDLTSDYLSDRLQFLGGKADLLFSLLVAAYIHDVGRFYDDEVGKHPQNLSLGIDKLRGMLENESICRAPNTKSSRADILERVKELCLCHDNKDLPSNAIEIAIIKIADALDCSQDRVYKINEIPEVRDLEDEFEQLKQIILRDKHPEDRFGCEVIEYVHAEYQIDEGIVDIKLRTADLRAATKPIKTLLRCLQLCEKATSESTKKLSKRIRVFIQNPKEGSTIESLHLLYPIDPSEIQRTVQVKINRLHFDVDIKDIRGTTQLIALYDIEVLAEKGLQSIISCMQGYKKVDWEKDVKVRELLKIGRNWKEVITKHTYSEKQGRGHWWKVVFKEKETDEWITLNKGQRFKLKESISWPACANVKNDEMSYKPVHPCNHVEINVFFPKDVKVDDISAWLEIRDKSRIILENHEHTKITLDRRRSRPKISTSFDGLAVDYRYALRWIIPKGG